MSAVRVEQIAAPAPVPAAYQAEVDLIHKDARLILDSFSVPFFVQAELAKDGYVRLSDLADRWEDTATARKEAPEELHFKDGENNYEKSSSKFVAIRLAQAIDRAKSASGQAWQKPQGHLSSSSLGALSPTLT